MNERFLQVHDTPWSCGCTSHAYDELRSKLGVSFGQDTLTKEVTRTYSTPLVAYGLCQVFPTVDALVPICTWRLDARVFFPMIVLHLTMLCDHP